jgi:hypothetical protein
MTAGPWNTGGRPDAADLEAARAFAEGCATGRRQARRLTTAGDS